MNRPQQIRGLSFAGTSCKPVVQIEPRTGKAVRVFSSIGQAELLTGIDKATISRVTNKVDGRKTAGGYIWLFQSEFMEVCIYG